jgi:hypothetical protein
MKLRASLRFRDIAQRAPDERAAASQFLRDRGVVVLRVGRRAMSVEAEPDVLARALDASSIARETRMQPVRANCSAGEWFDRVEFVPPPLLLDSGTER